MCTHLVFKSSSRLTEILERHVDLNRRALHPHSLKTIFCGHLQGRYKDSDVSIRHAFGGLTVLKARYGRTILKQYNNHRQTLRTEACINHTPDIGVKKSLQNFDELRQRLLCLMADFQKAQTPVLATTVNRGELAALAKPGKVNDVPTAGIRLENERILAVLAALPQLVHAPEGFRSRDLREPVEEALPIAYASPQAIYDLRKLRGKALVENVPGRRLYRPTREGLRMAAVLPKLKDSLLDPTLHTKRRKGRPQSQALHPPDCFYQAIDEQLHQLRDFLGLRPAS